MPQSLEQLTKHRGWNSELVGFLLPMARQQFIYQEWDFQESAEDDNPNAMWAYANSSGTSAADFATVANDPNGAIVSDTGTADDGGVSLYGDSINIDAARNPGLHVRAKIDDITECAFEIAMTDAPGDSDTVTCTDYDTPTVANTVTDGYIVGFDTDTATEKGFALVTDGTTDTGAGVPIGAATAGSPVTAGAYFDVILQGFLTAAYAVMMHNPVSFGVALETGPDTGKLMRPSIMTQTRESGVARFTTIDLIRHWRERL
jgi:hypothetical protein